MDLVACPECARQISSKLESCPECGHALRALSPPSIPTAPESRPAEPTSLVGPTAVPRRTFVFSARNVLIAAGAIGVVGVVVGILVAFTAGRARQASDRVLVFIVPGTYGNQWFWPNVIPGKATFASELLSALAPGSKLYPFLWASSVYHDKRVEAARNLAELIDRDAGEFDRVCMVGHSHGGNVALMAAALCRHKVDTIICLSTPHPYLRTVATDGKECLLPIYCSLQTSRNTGRILSISPTTDSIPDTWSNETLTGLTENEAIRLTTGWREALDHPRLANDNLTFRLFRRGNIVADKHLPLSYDEQTGEGMLSCSVYSFVQETIRAHSCIHSRRMGRVVGDVLRDGVHPTRVRYVCRLVQPADEDDGEPIPEAEYGPILASKEPAYEHAGWLLQRIDIRLDPQAKETAGEDDPDPYVSFTPASGKDWSLRTETQWNTLSASWSPGYFFPDGTECVLGVWDANHIANDTWLGGRRISLARDRPPGSLPADTAAKVDWSGTLQWVPLHY